MNYNCLTNYCDINDYLLNEKELALVIYSKTSVKKNNIYLNKNNFILLSTNVITKDIYTIQKYAKKYSSINLIIAIGGGTAIDIAKYVSYFLQKKVVCFPSMLSTNAYATNKVALLVNGKKETINAKLPDKIYLDKNMLNRSMHENLYGILDILSIYTALNDWQLACKLNGDHLTEEYNAAKLLLKDTVTYIDNILQYDIIKAYDLIGKSGDITNLYGSGRPESGSEHIFAKELEKSKKMPHCIAVANGIVIMMIAQDKFSSKILDCITELNIWSLNKKYNIDLSLIKSVFYKLKPRNDRYSVVDLLYNNNDFKNNVYHKFELIMKSFF